MTRTTEHVRSAEALRVAYMRRAHIRRNSNVREQSYKIKITSSMVCMSLDEILDDADTQQPRPFLKRLLDRLHRRVC